MRPSGVVGRDLRALATTMGLIWLGCAIFVGFEQIAGILTLRDFTTEPVQRLQFLTVWYWLPWVLFAPAVAWLSSRLPVRPQRWLAAVCAHLVLLLVLVITHSLAFSYVYHYSSYVTPLMATYEPWQHSGHFLFGDDGLLFLVIFYLTISGSLNLRGFLGLVRVQEQRAGALQRSLVESRLQALRMQVNPHFLFNVLNSICVLIRKRESREATEMLARLSGLLRRSLDDSTQQWITLERELETIEQYIAIERVRFGERLHATIDCGAELFHVKVPVMLLQPLVENALIHGFGNRSGACVFSLSCTLVRDEVLRVEVRDDGIGGRFYSDPEFAEGVGLRNVRERLEQTYGEQQTFAIDSGPECGTTVILEFPVR